MIMVYHTFEHIPAGSFKVARSSNTVYQAFLGTCLGVALYDHTTGTGGLIHILLPEPPGSGWDAYPEKYASTGIYMMIKELEKLGCKPQNLKAVMAGGGLIGPVNRQDINLDIGGRSAEIAVRLLKNAGITIVKSETGGLSSSTLELDMATGNARIKGPQEEEFRPETAFSKPSIQDIQDTVENLKPIPQTALKILRMFQGNRVDIEEVTKELAQDQVLSGQTLKICNSALFAGNIPIETLKDAVILLGEDLLMQSVIVAAIDSYYGQVAGSGYSLRKGGLFFHAVGVAATSEKLAQKCGKVAGTNAYTAGLLHDIGKVVLDQHVADSMPLLFRNLTEKKVSFLESEKKILGITHCETGAFLAKKWKLSKALYETIAFHHYPEQASEHQDLVSIVYLADLLMERFQKGIGIQKMQTESLEPVLDRLGLSLSDIPVIIDDVPLGDITLNP